MRKLLLRGQSLVNARVAGEIAVNAALPEGPPLPLRRAQIARGYGAVTVVPSPLAAMENVPAVLDV